MWYAYVSVSVCDISIWYSPEIQTVVQIVPTRALLPKSRHQPRQPWVGLCRFASIRIYQNLQYDFGLPNKQFSDFSVRIRWIRVTEITVIWCDLSYVCPSIRESACQPVCLSLSLCLCLTSTHPRHLQTNIASNNQETYKPCLKAALRSRCNILLPVLQLKGQIECTHNLQDSKDQDGRFKKGLSAPSLSESWLKLILPSSDLRMESLRMAWMTIYKKFLTNPNNLECQKPALHQAVCSAKQTWALCNRKDSWTGNTGIWRNVPERSRAVAVVPCLVAWEGCTTQWWTTRHFSSFLAQLGSTWVQLGFNLAQTRQKKQVVSV